MKASPTGVVKPNTVLIEFRLLRSTELEKEPTKAGTSASVKGMKTTSLKLDETIILFVKVSYVAEYELVLPPLSKNVFSCVCIAEARSGAV